MVVHYSELGKGISRKDNSLYRGLIRLNLLFYDKQPWPPLPSSNIIGCHLSISNWLFDISWKDLSLLTSKYDYRVTKKNDAWRNCDPNLSLACTIRCAPFDKICFQVIRFHPKHFFFHLKLPRALRSGFKIKVGWVLKSSWNSLANENRNIYILSNYARENPW